MQNLTYKRIFLFWVPLAATWLMMSVEGPFLAAVIARMAEPKFNLAAYGVAFSFALIVEAPIIMIMSATTALVKEYYSFCRLRKFTFTLNAIITGFMLIILIPPVFDIIAIDLINLPSNIARLTYKATFILLPWPGAIGFRRFYQGVLIRHNLTRRVAYGTIIRLVFMSITAMLFYFFFEFEGVVVGAAALSAGVVSEAIASGLMTRKTIQKMRSEDKPAKSELSYPEIFKFYYPLALTSMIGLGVHPMITFFMGQSRMAIESLAVLPVINSLVFIFRSVGLSYQEVGIALLDDKKKNYPHLRNFAIVLGISTVFLLSLIAFTPLSQIWFEDVSGLTAELSTFAHLPLMILTIIPGLTVLINFQRAMLVTAKNTKPITFATAAEVSGIILVLLILINGFNYIGAVAAATAFVLGRLSANVYLHKPFLRAVRSND
ncbi:MAG: hypothetical protein K9J16_17095 [Melioribacteraceae bacterium]|nr:hypothetical protein [Melioribacteraceae bacterium]MCF8353634.1 hypothetical protein [Melioribacteraceae bacterium]MCF8393404.1 hypothetical protein [Melioribacteraceae bacterium]MCF8419261.1 hypothetical protein [Melioribacteraceae bacterium]